MKLLNFKNYENYIFDFTFENITIKNNGMVDIEPKTLYHFCFDGQCYYNI